MASLNKVFLIGNLTREVELRYTPAGNPVGTVGIAVNRKWRNDQGVEQEETTFVDVTLWGKTAETASKHLGKGSQVHVEGRLKLESWDDKQTGQKRTKLLVVAEGLVFLGSPRGQGDRQQSAPPPRQPQRQAAPPPYADEQTAAEGDEIPF